MRTTNEGDFYGKQSCNYRHYCRKHGSNGTAECHFARICAVCYRAYGNSVPGKKVSIISVAVDAPEELISALAGKIGRLEGVSAKTAYSNFCTKDDE